jgi:hypothetical protein
VFLVDGLLGDAEAAGDVLPGPALGSGVVDLEGLQHLKQAAQGGHRPQAELGSRLLAAARVVASGSVSFSMASR